MLLIAEYLDTRIVRNDEKTKDVAVDLGISPAMVGQYRLPRGFKPSIKVALRVYTKYNVVLHPFAEESLQYEQGK
jgi:hypothetical protein